ncbi:cohesin domain-containing protein [Bacillus sp. REN16]|uniref:cohesin domain-containing protein n=1 Tax=Bacillus sp. REN16 TaxID=2887296 RepID=UPI001E2BA3BA|nr:cohesin domain-containing protein [Bacillus sp. REN16]MCC3359434.1 hypothetical protein [Bacillus sp. REN16]
MTFLKRLRENEFLKKKSTRIVGIILIVLLILAVIYFYINSKDVLKELFAPSITLVTPEPVESSNRNEIDINVLLSDLPDNTFPASSLSVQFNHNKLEFIGVKQGTMMTIDNSNKEKEIYNIPIWKSDPEVSNQTGLINTMYLDITGGGHAYVKEGFDKKDKNILLRLTFKLRDSVISGEIYNITIKDAVIATADNDVSRSSLATSNHTLKSYPAKIVVK